MMEIVVEIIEAIGVKIIDNITSIMAVMAIILGMRFVLVTFGFDIFTAVIAVLLLIWSYLIEAKRNRVKVMRKRGD